MGALDAEVERLVAAHRRLDEVGRSLSARLERSGDRQDTETRASTESNTEHDWSAAEVLAHVSEFVPYWQGEIERILAGASQPVPFGRVATDPVRIAVVDRDRSLPLRELLSRIDWSVRRVSARLGTLGEDEAARRGLHPARGELTVREIADFFLVRHTEEHAEQVSEAATDG